MDDLQSDRGGNGSMRDESDSAGRYLSRREFLLGATAAGAAAAFWSAGSLLAKDGLVHGAWSKELDQISRDRELIADYFGKYIGRTFENIAMPRSSSSGLESDLLGRRAEMFSFEAATLTPTRPETPTTEPFEKVYLPMVSTTAAGTPAPPKNPFLGHAHWVRYFDQNTRNHIDLTANDYECRFMLVNRVGGGNDTIWAVGLAPPSFNTLTAIQLTDFKLTGQALDLSALDMERGILYCTGRSTYSESKTTRQYVEDELRAWTIAINARHLIRDILEGSFSWREGQENNPSQAMQYFTDIHALPRRCDVPHAKTDGGSHTVGWGTVYDHSRKRLLYATTDVENGEKDEDVTVSGSRLYAVDLTEPPRFNQAGKDRREEKLILHDHSLPIHVPVDAPADFSADVAVAHLMINPWNENIVAVHNYAGVRHGSYAAEKYLDDAPAEIVYFDFSTDANKPGIFHLNLPGPNAGSNPKGEADRFMGHHSFISKNAMVANHGFRPVANNVGQTIIVEYPHGPAFLNSLPAGYSGRVGVATCHDHAEWWWSRHNDDDQYEHFAPGHLCMSPDRRFMVQDNYYLNDYDELLLWFRTPQGYSCYTVVRDRLPRDQNGNPLPGKFIHPHAVFVDDQTFLYNHIVAASCWQELCEDEQGKKEVCWKCSESEVRMIRIPDAILALDLLPLGSEGDAGVLATIGI